MAQENELSQITHAHMSMALGVPKEMHGIGVARFLPFVLSHIFKLDEQNSVNNAIKSLLASGVPWLQIIVKLAPFILAIFAGGSLNVAALIAAILELLPQPAPTPPPPAS